MKKIIVITDAFHRNMIQKSIKKDVQILLYIEFENYYKLNNSDRENEKQLFLEQMQLCLDNNFNDIDYVFSFITKIEYFKEKEELADWINMALLNVCRIPESKLINGKKIIQTLYPIESYRKIIENPQIQKLDGVVFGISHGKTGIKTDYLPGEVCNFSESSQDIFFNFHIAKRIWEEYPEKLQNIKYVIIDMFDYTYFNFETMFTGATLPYFIDSGLECPKEYDTLENKNIKMTSAREINEYLKAIRPFSTENEREILFSCFQNVLENDENAYCHNPLREIVYKLTLDDIEKYKQAPTVTAVQTKVYEKTIQKNIEYFCEFLNFLYGKNSQIKVILCLLPKYKVVEEYEKKVLGIWKGYFEDILRNIQIKFPFVFLNYKDDEEISGNIDFYWDITHLNREGSICFSKKLSKKITEILEEDGIIC